MTQAELKLEVWSDSDPEYGSLAVPPRLIWFWRIIGETNDYGSVVDECEHGYSTKEDAEAAGRIVLGVRSLASKYLVQRYEQYVEDVTSTQYEGMHPDDVDNVPMTFEEFVEYEKEVEQSCADDGPYGRIV